jgi:hypothetical protein
MTYASVEGSAAEGRRYFLYQFVEGETGLALHQPRRRLDQRRAWRDRNPLGACSSSHQQGLLPHSPS